MNTPKTIYLQCHAPDGRLLDLVHDDVTWCVDQINENDAVYVLAPAQEEGRVKDECLALATATLKRLEVSTTWKHVAMRTLDEIKRRLAQLEEETR